MHLEKSLKTMEYGLVISSHFRFFNECSVLLQNLPVEIVSNSKSKPVLQGFLAQVFKISIGLYLTMPGAQVIFL